MKKLKFKKGAGPRILVAFILTAIVAYAISGLTYGLFAQINLMEAVLDVPGTFNFLATTDRINLLIPILGTILALGSFLKTFNIFEKPYEDADEYGIHGTSRWADIDELRNGKTFSKTKDSKYSSSDLRKSMNMENGYILASKPNSKDVIIMPEETDVDNQNVMVIGSSGAAKSQAYVIPNLVNVRDKSIIVTDPKGELYDLTAQLKSDQGYKVYQIDFIHFMQSRYNPLDFVETDLEAQRVANTIISNFEGEGSGDNAFFKNSATNMLSALIIYVKASYPKEEANMSTLIEVYTNYVQNEEVFNEWITTVPDNHPAKPMLNSILDLTGNTRGSVTSTLNNGLSIFKLQKVRHMTKVSDFQIENFVDEKAILYVKLSMEDNTFSPLTSVFFSQMIDVLYAIAKESPGQKLPRKVLFLLDEFANIGKIDKYSKTLATCRSTGLAMHTIIQNIAQLEKQSMYGKEEARDIMSNHDTTIILRAKKEDTATTKWISEALGDTTKRQEKISYSHNNKGASKSINHDYVKRPLMTPEEVGSLDKHECIVMVSGHDPMFCHKAFQFKVYEGLLTDKNREPCYKQVREKLGYTGPLLQKPVYEINEEMKFSDYQKQIAAEQEQDEKIPEDTEEGDGENVVSDELTESDFPFIYEEDRNKEDETPAAESEEYQDVFVALDEINKNIDDLDDMENQVEQHAIENAINSIAADYEENDDTNQDDEENNVQNNKKDVNVDEELPI